MQLSSSIIHENESIPSIYTAQGKDISPPLSWINVPKESKSLALVMEDPDAPSGNWVHWIIYNLPSTMNHIDEGGINLPPQAVLAKNSWGKNVYNGPNPPSGTHHYRFTLYALDMTLKMDQEATLDDLKKVMQGHILAETTLTGTYQKK